MFNRTVLTLYLAAVCLTGVQFGYARFTSAKSAKTGPNYYLHALALAAEGKYDDAIESLLICQGNIRIRGGVVRKMIPKDVGRVHIRASDYLNNCFPNRELGVIHYRKGLAARQAGEEDAALDAFRQAGNYLQLSLSQLPTVRAADFLNYVAKQLDLARNTGRGPTIGGLIVDTGRERIPVDGTTTVPEGRVVLEGTCAGDGGAPVARLLIDERRVKLTGMDAAGETVPPLKVTVGMTSRTASRGKKSERFERVAINQYQPRPQARFRHEVRLRTGENTFSFTAVDIFGNITRRDIRLVLDNAPPELACFGGKTSLTFVLSDPSRLGTVTLTVDGEDAPYAVLSPAQDGKSTRIVIPTNRIQPGNTIEIAYADRAGNNAAKTYGAADLIPSRDAPPPPLQAESRTADLAEDTEASFVLTRDAQVACEIIIRPEHGSVTLTADKRSVIYRPKNDFNGSDRFTYRLRSKTAVSEPADVVLRVTPVNDPPAARSIELTTAEDRATECFLEATDPDGDPLTFEILSKPRHGILSGTPPTVRYAPEADFHGNDEFSFRVSDGRRTSETQRVAIRVIPVNDPPRPSPPAGQLRVTMSEDGAPVPFDLILRAVDPDDAVLKWTLTRAGDKGKARLEPAGASARLIYQPDADVNGRDTLAVEAVDPAGGRARFTVDIRIEPVNDAPVAVEERLSLREDKPLALTLKGKDPDGDALRFRVTVSPGHGRLQGAAPNLLYTPEEDYQGQDRFAFVVSDGRLDSEEAVVRLAIEPENDPPRPRLQTPATAAEDTGLRLVFTVRDENPDTVRWSLVSTPVNLRTQWVTRVGNRAILQCTPPADWHGMDRLLVQAADEQGMNTVLEVPVRITAVNDPPETEAQPVRTREDEPVRITLDARDRDGDAVAFEMVLPPAHGTLAGQPPSLTYTPSKDFSGKDRFAYRVSDGKAASPDTTVQITVQAVNDKPRAVPAPNGR